MIALTSGAVVAERSAATTLSEPALPPGNGWRPLRPRWIGPVTWTTATVSRGDRERRLDSSAILDLA